MAIGSTNNNHSSVQGYFTQDGQLIKNMTSLSEQKKAAAQNQKSSASSYYNESLFSKLGTVSNASSALKSQISSMASLTQYSSSVGKTASYTDKDVLSASVSSGAAVSNQTKTDVSVKQIASGQQNKGAALKADENSFGNQFNISITNGAGKTSTFNVGLTEKDDNKSAIQAMAQKNKRFRHGR